MTADPADPLAIDNQPGPAFTINDGAGGAVIEPPRPATGFRQGLPIPFAPALQQLSGALLQRERNTGRCFLQWMKSGYTR